MLRHIRQFNDKKQTKFVSLTGFLPFLVTKGSKVLENKANEPQVSKSVFSHLKWLLPSWRGGCSGKVKVKVKVVER